jgi:hypothetical protein
LDTNPLERDLDFQFKRLSETLKADGTTVKHASGRVISGRHLHILCQHAGDPSRKHDKGSGQKSSTAYTKLCDCQWKATLTAIYEPTEAPEVSLSCFVALT